MNIYRLTQNTNWGYGTYDSCVVVAPDEAAARLLHPRGNRHWDGRGWIWVWISDYAGEAGWTEPDNVLVEQVGIASPGVSAGVLCASFNAG